jgi:hypothetical protein
MPGTSDMHDPTFRAALERAEQQLDGGDYTGAAQTCAETYLLLLGRHPELLPPENVELVPPPPAGGASQARDIPSGFASADAARAFRRNWWPATGAITIVVGADRVPRVEMVKQRISLSEAAGYFEFLVQQLTSVSAASENEN